jgi:long-chain acyl-CoA synthetase
LDNDKVNHPFHSNASCTASYLQRIYKGVTDQVLTIIETIEASCRQFPDNAAMKRKVNGVWKGLSFSEIHDIIEKLASGLRQIGMQENSHIALIGPSSPRWVIAYLAILRADCIVIPIDKELKATELRYILHNADAEAIFVAEPQFETLLDIVDDLPLLEQVILLDSTVPEGVDQNKVTTIVAQLSGLWRNLVNDLQIPKERVQALESCANEALSLLSTHQPEQTKIKQKHNLLGDSELTRNKLLQEERLTSYNGLMYDEPLPPAINQADDCAVILYTSGTTGRAKGAMLSHRNIVSNLISVREHLKLSGNISTLSFLPINHVFEQVCGVLLPLSLGGTVYFAESIKKLGDNLNEVKPDFLLAVPAVYKMLLTRIRKNIQNKSLSRMLYRFPLTRKIVTNKIQQAVGKETTFASGGAALDPEIAQGFIDLGLNLIQGYGITETSPVIAAEIPFKTQPGTVGYPMSGVEIKIKNPNSEGEGEIIIKGPNVMIGYYNNPGATAEVLNDSWYATGDLGHINKKGMLSICGRVKNLIVTPNGKNVYPEEVENELLKSPYICEIMVYGHKLSATAEEVYAVVFPDEEALFNYAKEQNIGDFSATQTEELIRNEVLSYGKNLADYKRIKKFTLREEEFPKTSTRKIKRYAVEPEISTN